MNDQLERSLKAVKDLRNKIKYGRNGKKIATEMLMNIGHAFKSGKKKGQLNPLGRRVANYVNNNPNPY